MQISKFSIKLKPLILLFNFSFITNIYFVSPIKAAIESRKPNADYLKRVPTDLFYIIGSGDTLSIEVSEDLPELNRTITVDGEGIANLTRLNRIFVSGLTIQELIDLLNIEYKKFVFEPNVKISVRNYRPVKFFITGEVENRGLHVLPGSGSAINTIENFQAIDSAQSNRINNPEISGDQISLSNNTYYPSIIDALRKSGGITMYADLENIEVTRINSLTNGGGRIKTKVNLLDSLDLKNLSQNIRILDGDTIKVNKNKIPAFEQISKAMESNINPKFINVSLAGRVENPGSLKIGKNSSLNEAITLSGGLKVLRGKVKFIRYQNNGEIDTRKFRFSSSAKPGSYKNPYLRNGDFIVVGKGLLNNTNEVLSEITSPLQGIFSTYGFYRILTD